MRILEHREALRVVAAADRQLDGVRAGRLQDGKPTAAAAESTFAFADAVWADTDLRRKQRTRSVGHALGRQIAQIPVDAMQARRSRSAQRADGLSFGVLNGDCDGT